jgi:hypothetical protein
MNFIEGHEICIGLSAGIVIAPEDGNEDFLTKSAAVPDVTP